MTEEVTPAVPRGPVAAGGQRPAAAGGVISTWVRLLVVALVGLAQAPVLFGNLAPGDLGVWYLLFAVATLVQLSDLGLPATLGRAVSFAWGREMAGRDPAAAQVLSAYRGASLGQMYASALLATLVLGLAFAAVAGPAALLYFAHGLQDAPPVGTLLVPLLLFTGGVVLNVVATIPGACLSGSGDVVPDNAIRIGASLFGFGLVWFLVPVHRSLSVLCAAYLAQGAVALAASHLVLSWRRGLGPLRRLRGSAPLLRAMYRESTAVFVSRIGMWLTLESTLLVAGYFLGSVRVADFALLRQLVALGASVITAIPIAISPHIAAAHAGGFQDRVRDLYLASLRYSLILTVLWTLGLLLWAPTVVAILVGGDHFLGYAVLVPLAAGSLLELHAAPHAYLVWSVGKWPFAPWVLGGGALNLVLASAGCALFGFPGLAWGSMVAQAATVQWVQVAHALGQTRVALRGYLAGVIAPAAAYAVAVLAGGAVVRWLAGGDVPVAGAATGERLTAAAHALAGIGATTALAGVVAWGLVLSGGDRQYFLRLLRLRR